MAATTKPVSIVLLLAFAGALASVSAPPALGEPSDRAKRIGGKLFCMCGCNQILTACNHVGCAVSSKMLKELDQLVARNESDNLTIQSFIQEYGQQVLAEPPQKGLSRVAWFLPGVAFVGGLGIVLLVILRWRRRQIAAPARPEVSPEFLARARQQADQETED